ncbi:MAG TPA: CBS domain-containing protein [Nitrososphaerales archaeon]|nr:CBS domain-containing protein [Nitrososphaerales archaeon]
MSPKMIVVEGGESIKDAARKMTEANISSIIVTDSRGRPMGIVTERDIVQRVIAADKNPERRVEEVMSSPLITTDSIATLGEAAQTMVEKKVKRLLVKENENIVGIITQSDLQRGMMQTFSSLLLL